MTAGALLGYGALLVLAFGVRTVLHRRSTGDSGWRTPPSPAAWAGDGLFTFGVGAAIAAPVLDLLDVIAPIDALNRLPVHVGGGVLLAVGGGVALLAQIQLGSAWRAGIDLTRRYELMREGLFRVVRNPFYLGIILATTGVALMVPNVLALIGCIAVLAGCEIDVRLVEEPHLKSAMGHSYRQYTTVTGQFVPGLGRTSTS